MKRSGVRPSFHPSGYLSVCLPVDRQQQRRPAAGLLLSADVCRKYRSIAASALLRAPLRGRKCGRRHVESRGGGSTQTCLAKLK